MNPFEDGVVSANGLHGVMSRNIAEKGTRVVQAKEYPFFYNPMWSLFGDATPDPPGTYYYSKSEHKVFFWNIFDQVLIRPDLLSLFSNENMAILTSNGNISFISSQGVPDAILNARKNIHFWSAEGLLLHSASAETDALLQSGVQKACFCTVHQQRLMHSKVDKL